MDVGWLQRLARGGWSVIRSILGGRLYIHYGGVVGGQKPRSSGQSDGPFVQNAVVNHAYGRFDQLVQSYWWFNRSARRKCPLCVSFIMLL
jgi:hypothetical protein